MPCCAHAPPLLALYLAGFSSISSSLPVGMLLPLFAVCVLKNPHVWMFTSALFWALASVFLAEPFPFGLCHLAEPSLKLYGVASRVGGAVGELGRCGESEAV